MGAALKLLRRPAWGGGAARPQWKGPVGEPLPSPSSAVPLQWIMWCQSRSPAWPRRWSGGGSGLMARPAATMRCMWTSHAGATASGRSCTPWSRRKVRCLLLPAWPWPALSPGQGGHGVTALLGAHGVLHSCQQELCLAGHLVGRVARAGSLTYKAHLSLLSALPQALTPSWCTWPTRICTRCPTPR